VAPDPYSPSRASWLSIAAVVLLLAAIGGGIRVQPAGSARVIVRGSSARVLRGRIGWALPWSGGGCLVPLQGGQPYFSHHFRVVSASGETFSASAAFSYSLPPSVPSGPASNDWCGTLEQKVGEQLGRISAGWKSEELLDRRRALDETAAAALRAALGQAALEVAHVTVRIDAPQGLEPVPATPAVAGKAKGEPPVLFIGLDGADWELLDDYMARGLMPNLAALVREGTRGTLTTEHPPLSPLIWTTMMTGVSPLEHQVLDFTRFNPSTGVKEPITSDERRVPAIWNMVNAAGKSAAVFGLWATYPAEPVRGLLVSDRLFTFLFSEGTPPPGIVYPSSRETWARQALSDSEKSVDYTRLKSYLPWLSPSDYETAAHEPNPYDRPASALRRILVETEVYERLSMSYLAGALPDLAIVYYQGTDTIGHTFAPYAPPRQAQVSEADYDHFHAVPELYFQEIDRLLGRYRALADQRHAILMLASDHGFHWKEDRPTALSSFAAASAAKWHRSEGIYLIHDPRRAGNPTLQHGRVRQIAATLLALTGSPRGAGIQEPPLDPAADPTSAEVDYRPYFKRRTAATTAAPAGSNDEAIAKLRALGYIGGSESTAPRPASVPAGSTKTAGAFNNEGLVEKNEGHPAEAIAAFEKALAIDPNLASAAWNLSDFLFSRGEELDRADALLVRAASNGLPEATKYTIERAIAYQRSGRGARSLHLLESAVAAQPNDPELHMFRGRYRVESKDCSGALDDFRTASTLKPADPVAHAAAGYALLCLGRQTDAQSELRRSLEIEPNQPMLRRLLGGG
jgi:Flp pilus assembly protein TadD